MKRKFLEDLGLEKDVIDKIMAENGADIEAEKAKTTKATTELEDAIKQLDTANNTIKDLKKNNADNEELQQTIKEHEETIKQMKKDHEAEITKLARESINNELLSKYKAKNNKAVMALVDGIEASDNETYRTLLDSKLKAISEADDTKFMFGDLKVEPHYEPAAGGDPIGVNPFAKETYNLTQQGKLLKENPAQAKELMAAAGFKL